MNFHTFSKIILLRVTIIFVSLFLLSSCFSPYREHFVSERSLAPAISGEYYSPSIRDGIWILPDKKIKDTLIASIDSAQERIWIQIYMWTDKNILQSVIAAHNRGVDVRVLLERNVYGLPRVNIPIYSQLEKAGIPVKYSDSYRFTFTHSKFWIIDDTYYISTGNFTKSFFESNRDFVFFSSDSLTREFLTQLFLGDFSYLGIDRAQIPNHLVLSPIDSRSKIEYLFDRADDSIRVYTQTLTDDRIIDILEIKKSDGVSVEICTADNESNRLASSGTNIEWKRVKKPYLHGKVVFVDGERLFIGSQNFTNNSIENNREVGVMLSDSGELFSQLLEYYKKDCFFE